MSNDKTLLLVGGGVVALIALGWLFWPSPPSELVRLEEIPPLDGRLIPDWERSTRKARSRESQGDEILIFVDTSHSMGGFLPLAGAAVDSKTITLRTVAQLTPGHVLSTGAGDARWFSVDEAVKDLGGMPVFEQSSFVGKSSDLESAVGRGVSALQSGEARMVILISDLVSTGDAKGAMGTAGPLLDWLSSEGLRAGRYDIGLLGVRLPYWGVASTRCQNEKRDLGCWYSEHADRYQPLERRVDRPLYLLILGATGNDEPSETVDGAVEGSGRSLLAALEDQKVQARWELLTEASRRPEASLHCRVPDSTSQYALYRDGDGRFACRRDEDVELACTAKENGRELEITGAEASWAAVTTRVESGGVRLTVDCASLRDEVPSDDLELSELVVAADSVTGKDWTGWSARSDEFEDRLQGTLQLDLFLKSVRLQPRVYRLELERPLLRGRSRKEAS